VGSLVVNTSNKSELAVGYSTLYGDSVGAISLIGDLYKSQVYQLCQFIQKTFGAPFPHEMLLRAPSAELRDNQKDQDSLPPYDELDALLIHLLSGKFSFNQLKELGFPREMILKVNKMLQQAEYKRWQFAPILKINEKSFGFGHRMPLCKSASFHTTINEG
jgi:NAD+ synthase (glutamine-hydrolysing)